MTNLDNLPLSAPVVVVPKIPAPPPSAVSVKAWEVPFLPPVPVVVKMDLNVAARFLVVGLANGGRTPFDESLFKLVAEGVGVGVEKSEWVVPLRGLTLTVPVSVPVVMVKEEARFEDEAEGKRSVRPPLPYRGGSNDGVKS